ncbi:MAG: hypothetical protein AAF720_00790 [Pseudomonadota bacterium]
MEQVDISSFSDVVMAFGDAALADGIGARPHQPRDWRIRNNIPSEWWLPIEAFAKQNNRPDITLSKLAVLASERLSNNSKEAI